MLKNWLKNITSLVLLFVTALLAVKTFSLTPSPVLAVESDRTPIPANILSNHIDRFFTQGAKGFLVWQYSGDLFGQFEGAAGKGTVFGNDGHSFFYNNDPNSKDAQICKVLKTKSNQYPDKFVGVNIFNAGASQYSSEALSAHFSWLRNDCGVKIIRVFAKEGGASGMTKALAAADNAGVQLIIAVGDYSNGSIGLPSGAGKTWYETEYKGEYKTFAQSIVNAVNGNSALYGLELANEAHCGGQSPDTLTAYTNWGLDIGSLLRQATGNVGYGQMADPNGICDSPTTGGFKTSNSISPITMTSAHYYTQENMDAALQALQQSQELGKAFYVGEAGWPMDQSTVSDQDSSTNKDAGDYITYPLVFNPDLSISSKENKKDVIIANLVQDQGYEVQCASPEIWVTKSMVGEWQRYFEINTAPAPAIFSKVMTGTGTEDVDLSTGTVAMFRGNEASSLSQKGSSYEAYFGVLTDIPTNADNAADPINSGVANSLLTLDQQCTLKINNLLTAEKLCETLENPKECALYTPITNTDYYLYSPNPKQSLLEAYQSSNLSCSDLSRGWDNNYSLSETDFNKLNDAILNMPLNLDKVYRYAFLVIAPEQDPDEGAISSACQISNENDNFWFLGKLDVPGGGCTPNYKNIKKHAPMFIAFKIPDFGTNRTNELSFKDSGQVTAEAITDLDYQELMQSNANQAKNNLVTKIQTNQSIHWQGSEEEKLSLPLNCSGMPQCEGAHGTTLLRQALVDIINGSNMQCDSSYWDNSTVNAENYLDDTNKDRVSPLGSVEKAGDIGTSTNQNISEKTNFLDEYDFNGGLVVPEAQKTGTFDWGIRLTESLARKLAEATKPGDEKNDVRVKIYIVSPVGASLTTIQSSLKSLFDDEVFEKMVENNVLPDSESGTGRIPKYFPLTGAEYGYTSTATETYKDGTCNCLNPGETWENLSQSRRDEYVECEKNCKTKSFSVKLKDDNVGLFQLGAKLGWMIRKIQENLRTIGSKGHEYISSCERVEDMFLGRCSASASEEYNQYPEYTGDVMTSDQMDCPMTLAWDDALVSKAYKNKEDFLLEIKASFPATMMDSDYFDLVIEESAKYGLNPALILALGREETAWGAVGNIKALGCLGGGELSSLASKEEILDHQLKCVANNFDTSLSCEEFACKYSSGDQPPCSFDLNPNFPVNLPKIYRNLIK